MNYYHLLAQMADIKERMDAIKNEEGFENVSLAGLQVSPAMFRFLFPDGPKNTTQFEGYNQMIGTIGDMQITAWEKRDEKADP